MQKATEADNCVRENKNGNVFRFLSYLVAAQKLSLTSVNFGRVGHTHGCLGSSAEHADAFLRDPKLFPGDKLFLMWGTGF